MKDEKETIENALLEAVAISRWGVQVLSEGESQHIVDNIFVELKKIGYEIKKI